MAHDDEASPEPTRKVGVREFRGNFAGFMRQVRHGASFAVTARHAVIAIVPPPPPSGRRRPGTLRGQIDRAPDLDVLPPEPLAAMKGEDAEGEDEEGEEARGFSSTPTPCSGGCSQTRDSAGPPRT